MAIKSFFTSFFDSISDVETKFHFNNELRTKLIEDRYYNAFRGKQSFPAIVLYHNLYQTGGAARSAQGSYVIAKVRPIDLHGWILPHPCRDCEGRNISARSINASKLRWMQNIINLHPTAYSEAKDAPSTPNIGETVECFFQEQGPDAEGRMRGIRFRNSVISGTPGNHEFECLRKINDDFSRGNTTSINSFRNNPAASQLLGLPSPED